ncbi:hypothetical protein HPHPP26_1590 [Helicobacter pylori Hp P-26]|nr:hypothetical protein HPHPP26_1590 [Helicobacter pylori Hp P-26]
MPKASDNFKNKKILFSVFSDYLVGNLSLIQTIVFKKRFFRGGLTFSLIFQSAF